MCTMLCRMLLIKLPASGDVLALNYLITSMRYQRSNFRYDRPKMAVEFYTYSLKMHASPEPCQRLANARDQDYWQMTCLEIKYEVEAVAQALSPFSCGFATAMSVLAGLFSAGTAGSATTFPLTMLTM